MTKQCYGLLLAVVVVFGAGNSRAAVINDVEIYGEAVTFGNDAFATQNGFAGQSVLAGEDTLTASGGNTISAWCIDLFHEVYLGSGQDLTYNGMGLAGASNGNGGALTTMQANEIAGLVAYGDKIVASGASVDQAAGVQMAIWATEYAGLTFAGPTTATEDEQSDLALAPSLYGRAESLVSSSGTQELVGETNQVPEPASLGLMGAGLLGLGFTRRRSPLRA